MSNVTIEPAATAPVRVAPSHRLGAVAGAGVRRAFELAQSAPATLCVVTALVAMWLLEREFFGQIHGTRKVGYLAFGALPNADILGRGSPDQWWRFVASGLVHDRTNPLHVAANGVALVIVGSVIERLYGRVVVLASLTLGVVAGGVTWLLASALDLAPQPDYTVGCSAGVCALVGMMLVYAYRHRASMPAARAHAMKAQAALGVALMLLLGLTVPNLNNFAHAGGLLCGALLAFLLPAGEEGRMVAAGRWWRPALWAVLLVVAVSLVFAGQNVVVRLLSNS